LNYDGMGQVISQTKCISGKTYQLGFNYDTLSRPASVTYPDGEVVSYRYDTAGRLTSMVNNRNESYINQMKHNPAGQLSGATYGNGTVSAWGYDPQRAWLTSASVTTAGATLYQAQYSYLSNGLIQSATSSTNQMNQTYT